jgi:hypothetical protein
MFVVIALINDNFFGLLYTRAAGEYNSRKKR